MLTDFFREELVFILIALFVFAIAVFVVTRPFVEVNAKKVLSIIGIFLLVGLIAHYTWRLHHMESVKKAFAAGKNILCIDKTNKIGYVLINRGEWKIVNDEFVHPEFPRAYNIRQCVVE
ncbi:MULTISPECIES: hypothetical protein [Nitratiruptor]|uniref:Uncharacterized protein n=1 Tax=Nitratiruptor tergarcus DSM 16512 TaxID=1069081 RepID=A0A1W1WRF1_9BACT|nr:MULTISPECIES: hypothetical protein [Nitratiruptor]BCD63060.1 hypothetical protein NitYY0813_C1948 [Nitratiruptor sp. YY08-13]BCD66995.1 hypothetical protein NitYY0826_C1950 [Nitratiruptor sp. YY08-26]SMC08580.1 hypothetical protein SAMN05660197_0337 [Nitratiruptor tergarcus DSM 16512]